MDEITRMQRRTQAYWYVDGISELVGGAIIAAVGILLYASTLSTNDAYSTGAIMAMIFGFPLSAKVVRTVKHKITHERTGYVKYPESPGRRRGVAVAVAAFAGVGLGIYAASTGDVTFEGLLGTVMLATLGLSVTIGLALRAYRLELPRFYIASGVVAVTSVVALVAGLSFIAGMGAVWTALGVVAMLTGATVFAEYLTKHHGPEADAS